MQILQMPCERKNDFTLFSSSFIRIFPKDPKQTSENRNINKTTGTVLLVPFFTKHLLIFCESLPI